MQDFPMFNICVVLERCDGCSVGVSVTAIIPHHRDVIIARNKTNVNLCPRLDHVIHLLARAVYRAGKDFAEMR